MYGISKVADIGVIIHSMTDLVTGPGTGGLAGGPTVPR